MTNERNFFEKFVNMDVSKWTEKKNGLDYLEWGAAITLLKNEYPLSKIIIHENEDGRPWFTDQTSNSGWVKITVIVPELDLEQTDILAIMDFKNNALPIEKCDAVAANKAIRRCLTKVIAETTGIGLTLYGKSESTSDEKEIKAAKEKLNEVYSKKVKLSDKAKKEADAIVSEVTAAIDSALDDAEKIEIYEDARKKLLAIRK